MLAARDSHGWRLRQVTNFVFTPGLGEYAAAAPLSLSLAAPAYRAIRVARVLGLIWDKAYQ
jgi:hypothetical protein